jgi:uncharacterized protein YkwD
MKARRTAEEWLYWFLRAVWNALNPPAAPPPPPPPPEDDLLYQINLARAVHRLPAYRRSEPLARAAQTQADYMARSGEVGHFDGAGRTVADRLRFVGYRFASVEENVAGGNWLDDRGAVALWMDSRKGHREVILDPNLTECGYGSAVSNGIVYWCAVFARPF